MLKLVAVAASASAAMKHSSTQTSEARQPSSLVCACSLDGFHSQDLAMYISIMPNSTMARLAASGVTYPNAYLPGPSDSFPGLLAITTGNNVTATGVYYGAAILFLNPANGS